MHKDEELKKIKTSMPIICGEALWDEKMEWENERR